MQNCLQPIFSSLKRKAAGSDIHQHLEWYSYVPITLILLSIQLTLIAVYYYNLSTD
jgi:hypothetical protein